MALSVEVGSFTKETTGNPSETQDVNTGFIPKALILFTDGKSTADSDIGGNAGMGYGFSDGTNNKSCFGVSQDNVTTTNAGKYTASVGCIGILGTTPSIIVRGTAAFSATKFTMTWIINNTTAYRINYIIFGGTDITGVEVGTFTKSVSLSVPVTDSIAVVSSTVKNIVEGRGILFLTHNNTLTLNSTSTSCLLNIGCACKANGTQEGCIGYSTADALGDSTTQQVYSESKIIQKYSSGVGGGILAEADFGGFTANGFDLIWTTNDTGATFIAYLIINGGQWQVGNETASTSVTTKATTTSFLPKGLMTFANKRTAEGITEEDYSYQIGVTDGTTQASDTASEDDAVGTTQVGRGNNISNCLRYLDQNGSGNPTVNGEASFSAFGNTSFTLNWTDSASSAWKFIWLVCGDNPGQFGLPISDISNTGSWLDIVYGDDDTSLWDELDESEQDNLTTAINHKIPIKKADTFEVGLTQLFQPIDRTNHKVSFAASGPDGVAARAVLLEGSTIIATSNFFKLTPTITKYEYTLTSGEANSISLYTDLRIRIIPSICVYHTTDSKLV